MESEVRVFLYDLVERSCKANGVEVVALTPEMRLAELGLDSLKIVEIIFQMENRFEVQIDEELLVQIETLGDTIKMFESAPVRA